MPGDDGAYPHPGAYPHGDHHILEGEGQRDGGEGVFAEAGHEHGVHRVVQRLHQHGDHHGQAHHRQELSHGHGAQLILALPFPAHASRLPFR